MYNLLVSCSDGIWDNSTVELSADRFTEYTEDCFKEKYSALSNQVLEELTSFPTLFAYEELNKKDARLGYISRIRVRYKSIAIEIKVFPEVEPISYTTISKLKVKLDIHEWEMNRTHWAIKNENLLDVLLGENLITPYQYSIAVNNRIEDLTLENIQIRAALHQADRLSYLGRMATMMAHNIKNPVNNITTATVSMLMGIKNKVITAEQLVPSLERILNNSDRLNKIIENFRNFAQGDRTTFSNINLNEIIEDIFQLLFVGQYQNHQIELIKEFTEFPVMAKTNSFAMQEILITLLNNAKEVLIDKESKQVKIITWKNNDKVGFNIEDSGGGIEEAKRDKLFSPFFSSKNDGMGLGLYFCKEILKDLEGHIEYYPAPHGAGFRVMLPIATEL